MTGEPTTPKLGEKWTPKGAALGVMGKAGGTWHLLPAERVSEVM